MANQETQYDLKLGIDPGAGADQLERIAGSLTKIGREADTILTKMGRSAASTRGWGTAARGAAAGVDRAADATDNFGRSARKTDSSVAKLTKSVLALAAGYLSIRAAFREIGRSVDVFSEIETGLIGVSKTTDIVGGELERMFRRVQDLSGVDGPVAIATTRLLELGEAAGQLGVAGSASIQTYVETVGKLGAATNLHGAEAAQILARIMNVQGEAPEEVERFASVLVRLGNESAASEAEIAKIANEVSLSTAQFRIGSTAAAGLGAAMASLGIQARLGGSVIGKVLRDMQIAVSKGGAELEAFGDIAQVEGERFAEVFEESSVEALRLFLRGLSKFGEESAAVLEDLGLSGDEVGKVLPPLAANVGLLERELSLASDEARRNTALNREAAAAFDSWAADSQRLQNELNAVRRELGLGLVPELRVAARELGLLARENQSAAQSFGRVLGRAVVRAVAAVQLLANNLDLLVSSLGGVAIAFAIVKVAPFVIGIAKGVAALAQMTAALRLSSVALIGWSKAWTALTGVLASNAITAVAIAIGAVTAALTTYILRQRRATEAAEDYREELRRGRPEIDETSAAHDDLVDSLEREIEARKGHREEVDVLVDRLEELERVAEAMSLALAIGEIEAYRKLADDVEKLGINISNLPPSSGFEAVLAEVKAVRLELDATRSDYRSTADEIEQIEDQLAKSAEERLRAALRRREIQTARLADLEAELTRFRSQRQSLFARGQVDDVRFLEQQGLEIVLPDGRELEIRKDQIAGFVDAAREGLLRLNKTLGFVRRDGERNITGLADSVDRALARMARAGDVQGFAGLLRSIPSGLLDQILPGEDVEEMIAFQERARRAIEEMSAELDEQRRRGENAAEAAKEQLEAFRALRDELEAGNDALRRQAASIGSGLDAQQAVSDAVRIELELRSRAADLSDAQKMAIEALLVTQVNLERVLAGREAIADLEREISGQNRLRSALAAGLAARTALLAAMEAEEELRDRLTSAARSQRAQISALAREQRAAAAAGEIAVDLAGLEARIAKTKDLVEAQSRGRDALRDLQREQAALSQTEEVRNRIAAEAIALQNELAESVSTVALADAGLLEISLAERAALADRLAGLREQLDLNEKQAAALDALTESLKRLSKESEAVQALAAEEGRLDDLETQLSLMKDFGVSANVAARATQLMAVGIELSKEELFALLEAQDDLQTQIAGLESAWTQLATGIQEALSDSLQGFFEEGIDGFEEFADAIRKLLVDVFSETIATELGDLLSDQIKQFRETFKQARAEGATFGEALSSSFSGSAGFASTAAIVAANIIASDNRAAAAVATAVGAAIGAAIGHFAFPVIGPVVGAQLGAIFGSILGSFIKSGTPEFFAAVEVEAGNVTFAESAMGSGFRRVGFQVGGEIREGVDAALREIGGQLTGISDDITLKLKNGLSVFLGSQEFDFGDALAEGLEFAIVEILKSSEVSGIEPEVARALQFSGADSLRELLDDLQFVRDQVRSSLDDVARRILEFVDEALSAARRLESLGVSPDPAFATLGRQLADLKDQILGVEEDPAARIRRQSAALNAQVRIVEAEERVRVARLEMERETLAAEVEILRAEARVGVERIDLRKSLLEADQEIIQAEAGLLGAKLRELAALDAALEASLSILASLPDLISEADIQQAIGRIGGGAPRETRDVFLDRVGGAIAAARNAGQQWADDLARLEAMLERGRISQERYAESIRAVDASVSLGLLDLATRINRELGRDAEADRLEARAGEIRLQLSILELRILRERAQALGILDDATRELIEDTLEAAGELRPAGGRAAFDPAPIQRFLDAAFDDSSISSELREIQADFLRAARGAIEAGESEEQLLRIRTAHGEALDGLRRSLVSGIQVFLDQARGVGRFERELLDLQREFADVRAGLTELGEARDPFDVALEELEAAAIDQMRTVGDIVVDGIRAMRDRAASELGVEPTPRGPTTADRPDRPGGTSAAVNALDILRAGLRGWILAAGEASDATRKLEDDLRDLEAAERLAVRALGFEFLNSLEQLGVSLPTEVVLELARAEFELARMQAIASATALAAAGAFEGLSIGLEDLLEALANADFDASRFAPRRRSRETQSRAASEIDRTTESLERQIRAWERLRFGPLTQDAIRLREQLLELEEAARTAGRETERLQAAWGVQLDAFVDDALAPIEDLGKGELRSELDGILDKFVDMIVAFEVAGANAEQMLRLQDAFQTAMQDFLDRATRDIQSLVERLRGAVSTDTAEERFLASQTDFADTIAAARAGDLEALHELAGAGEGLEEQILSFLGRGAAGQAALRDLLEALEGLDLTEAVPEDIELLREQAERLLALVDITSLQPSNTETQGGFDRVRDAVRKAEVDTQPLEDAILLGPGPDSDILRDVKAIYGGLGDVATDIRKVRTAVGGVITALDNGIDVSNSPGTTISVLPAGTFLVSDVGVSAAVKSVEEAVASLGTSTTVPFATSTFETSFSASATSNDNQLAPAVRRLVSELRREAREAREESRTARLEARAALDQRQRMVELLEDQSEKADALNRKLADRRRRLRAQ